MVRVLQGISQHCLIILMPSHTSKLTNEIEV